MRKLLVLCFGVLKTGRPFDAAIANRKLGGLQVVKYAIPEKCVAGYYPECNVLVPLWHHAKESKVPAAKSIPVRIELQHQSP